MSTIWLDDIDSEGDYDSEGGYDTEADYDSEDARSDAARRARARQIALARRRVAVAKSSRPSTNVTAATPSPRQTVAAIRNLDLETKVGADSLRRMLEESNRRASRATYATVASLAVDQALDSFQSDLNGHDIVRAGLRSTPLLLLSPQRKRRGFEGFLLDPRVIGAAAVAGVLAGGKFFTRGTGVQKIGIVGITDDKFVGYALDGKDNPITVPFAWSSQNATVISVTNAADGSYTAGSAGTTMITLSAGGRNALASVTVDDSGDIDLTPIV